MDPHTWPCKSRTTSTNIHSAAIRNIVLKTHLGRWTIGRSGERGSGISVLPARHDDDDDDFNKVSWLILRLINPYWVIYCRRDYVILPPHCMTLDSWALSLDQTHLVSHLGLMVSQIDIPTPYTHFFCLFFNFLVLCRPLNSFKLSYIDDNCYYTYLNRAIGEHSTYLARVQSQVDSFQRLKRWYLMPPCLTFSIIR